MRLAGDVASWLEDFDNEEPRSRTYATASHGSGSADHVRELSFSDVRLVL